MTTSEKLDIIAKALCDLQIEIKDPDKNAKNPHYKNDYADLTSVVQANRKVLAKHGLSIVQGSGITEGVMYLSTLILHISGQWIRSEYLVMPEKPGPQSLGSAFTYARRYSQRGLLNVADADDDGEQATHQGQYNPQPTKTPPAASTSRDVYKIPFGKKYIGKTLSELKENEILGYMEWLQSSVAKDKKPLSEQAQEFINQAESYLAQRKPQSEEDVPFPDDIPF